MRRLLILFGLALCAGLFFILADLVKLPSLTAERALLSAARRERRSLNAPDALFLGWAVKVSRIIRLEE